MSFTTQQYYPQQQQQQQQFRQQSRDRISQQPSYARVNLLDNYQIQQQQIPQQIISNPKNIESRLAFLENNFTKLCKQQDSLLPLLTLQEKLPNLINESILNTINAQQLENENMLKQLTQKINEFDSNLKNQEIQLQKNLEKLEINPVIIQFNGKIEQLTHCIGDLQTDFINYQNLNEGNHQQVKTLYQGVFEKMEIYKENFNQQIELMQQQQIEKFKNFEQLKSQKNSNNNQTHFEELIDQKIGLAINQVSDSISQQINSQIDRQISELQQKNESKKFTQLTNQFEDETNNIYKDIGYIKCEIDQITSTFRKQFIEEKASEFPKQLDKMHYSLKINNIEEEARISELQQFCEDNTERISSDCKNIEQKIERIHQFIKERKTLGSEDQCYIKSEIEFLTQKYVELNYQSGGAKKKYAFDMRKIEEKIEEINQIEESIMKFAKINKKRKINIDEDIIFQENLTEKVQPLFQLINTNIDSIGQLLESLEQKLSICKIQCEKL